MKKIVAGAASLLLAGAAALSLTACGLFSAGVADGNYPSDVASDAGEYGSGENWLAAQEVPSTYERRLYEEAVESGSFTGTYYEFLASLGLSSEDDTAYVSRALCSTVAIEVSYTENGTRVLSDGTGVIYRLDKEAGEAYVVTNFHVVAHATGTGGIFGGYGTTTDWDAVTLTLYGGQTIEAARGESAVRYVRGSNDGTDLAVLQVTSDALKGESVLAASFAQPVIGEEAYAIGNAEGEGISVTRGVVSKLAESVTILSANEITSVTFDAIRTDAAVNQGNSGGGLFNERGELLGIVTARREQTAGGTTVDGFGYAIPAEDVNAVLSQLGCPQIDAAQRTEEAQPRVLLDRTAAAARAANAAVTVMGEDGEGSGVIFDLDRAAGNAYILTNYHVVYSSREGGMGSRVTVYLYEDEQERFAIPARCVGGVMEEDIAVLAVEESAVLAASSAEEVVAADAHSLTVGEDVFAVGNAGGYGLALSYGVVSVPGEYINVLASDNKTTLTLYGIRTDAAVNHGNSGGGLFNETGELVGIVSARSDAAGVVAFGYAIPANRALLIAQNILDNAAGSDGAVCASLGVSVYAAQSRALLNERTGKAYLEEKVVIGSLPTDGVAARMGLDIGDTLVSASVQRGGETVYSLALTRVSYLSELMYAVRLGDTVTVTVSRGGEAQTFSYTFDSVQDFSEIG